LALAQPSTLKGWVYTLRDGAACKVGEALVVKNTAKSPLRLQTAAISNSLTVKSETKLSVVELPIGSDSAIAASFHLRLAHERPLGHLHHVILPSTRRSRHWYAIVARVKLTAPMHAAWQISGVDVRYRLNGRPRETFLREDVRVAAANRCRP